MSLAIRFRCSTFAPDDTVRPHPAAARTFTRSKSPDFNPVFDTISPLKVTLPFELCRPPGKRRKRHILLHRHLRAVLHIILIQQRKPHPQHIRVVPRREVRRGIYQHTHRNAIPVRIRGDHILRDRCAVQSAYRAIHHGQCRADKAERKRQQDRRGTVIHRHDSREGTH